MLGLCCCSPASAVVANEGYSSLQLQAAHCHGFSCCGAQTRCAGFSSCSTRALSVVVAHTGFVAPWHVKSSWTRDWTHVPCISRQILTHCATRKVPRISIFKNDICIYAYAGSCCENLLWVFIKIIGIQWIDACGIGLRVWGSNFWDHAQWADL